MKYGVTFLLGVLLAVWNAEGATWKKLNPTGLDQINALYMLNDSTAIVVGGNGGVLKTTDGGYTWYAIDMGTNSGFWDITFVNQTTGFIVGDNLILRTTDGGETWEDVFTSGEYYTGVFFLDAQHGWVAGSDNTVLKTTDGGNNWEYIPVTYGYNIYLNKPFFLTPDTGFVVGSEETVFKTTDGGQTWILVNQRDFTPQWNFIVFNTDTSGWIGNYRGRFFTTRVGGDVWAPDPALTDSMLQYQNVTDMQFVTQDLAYVVAYGGIIAKTLDGGRHWNVTQIPGAENDYLFALHFADQFNGMVAGDGGVIYKTTNGGQSWQKVSTAFTTENIVDAAFLNDTTGWIVTANGSIFRTTNRGKSWKKLLEVNNPAAQAVSIGDTIIYAVGQNGLALRSSIHTDLWTQLITNESSNLLAVSAVNDSTAWAVGEDATVLRTNDYGNSWQLVQFPAQEVPHLFDVFAFSLERAVVAGQGYLYQTFDGGQSWSGYRDANETFTAVFFADSSHGWATTLSGKIYATTDAGANWTVQTTGTSLELNDVFFLNTMVGWAVGQNGIVLETVNGGQTWDEDKRSTSQDLNSVVFTSQNSGWALGNGGVVLSGDASTVVSIPHSRDVAQLPTQIQLYPAYPNPFNPATTIPLALPQAAMVRLTIFNALGQVIRTLWNGQLNAGNHQFVWDGRNADGQPVSSGIYWIRLEATMANHPMMVQTQKVLFMK